MEEIWKDIVDYEGLYQVSNLGRVKRLEHYVFLKNRYGQKKNLYKEKIANQIETKHGYLKVSLSKNGKGKQYFVHRLVAQAFISNIENKPEIDHIDTNKKNNCVDNLRFCWHLENMVDNTNTYSKLNSNHKKRIIYDSLKQDLLYQLNNGEEIKYSDSVKEKVKQITGKDVNELLKNLCNTFFYAAKIIKKYRKKK